jgi:hypothetical protein
MKASRRRSDNVLNMPPVDAAVTTAAQTAVSEEQIAWRAYELSCARGREDGYDLDDWLQAERDLRGGEETITAA